MNSTFRTNFISFLSCLSGINYQRYDMSDWVETSDESYQIESFKQVAGLMDSIISKEVNKA